MSTRKQDMSTAGLTSVVSRSCKVTMTTVVNSAMMVCVLYMHKEVNVVHEIGTYSDTHGHIPRPLECKRMNDWK